jgi:hypothetical protein
MSPVAKGGSHAGRALAVGTGAIAIIAVILFLAATVLSDRNSTELRIGDQTFQGGNAERLAEEIADRGPILYGDVSGAKDRDVILQHLGKDPDTRWYMFRAQPPDKGRDCTWEWQPDEQLFRAKCDDSMTAPADGKGLERFPVKVRNGRLDVDLNFAARTTTTTTTTTTTFPESGNVPSTTGG